MIKVIALALFGWFRTPERFVRECGPYIRICLQKNGWSSANLPSNACCVALSQLAYLRAARGTNQRPRFRTYVKQMEEISTLAGQALAGRKVNDERVRSILFLHRAI